MFRPTVVGSCDAWPGLAECYSIRAFAAVGGVMDIYLHNALVGVAYGERRVMAGEWVPQL